jgi:hypothetical protein
VAHDLIAQGVGQSRLGVEGFADQRPVADNGTEAGKKLNRRVEVVILPTAARSPIRTVSNERPAAAPVRTITPPAPARPILGNKDAAIDRTPVIGNK